VAPSSTLDIEVFVGNVRQDPNSAYTLSGTTLSFTGAPPSGTNNIYVVHQAKSVGTIDVGTNGVSTISIQADAITEAKIADDAVESEHLNDNIISGQTELASAPASTDELLISDGGTLKRIDVSLIGGTNTPSFSAYLSNDSDQSISDSTSTKIQFDAERFDTAGAFDTSNYKFTVPSGQAGKYLIILQAKFSSSQQNDIVGSSVTLKINGSESNSTSFTGPGYISGTKYPFLGNQLNVITVQNLSASDYLEGFAFVKTNGAGTPKVQEGNDLATFFMGFKLVEW